MTGSVIKETKTMYQSNSVYVFYSIGTMTEIFNDAYILLLSLKFFGLGLVKVDGTD